MANDNFDPRFDDPRAFDGPGRNRRPDPNAGKAKLLPPGILMILIGVIGLGYWGLATFNTYVIAGGPEAQVDMQVEGFNRGVDSNPNVPADQRKAQKEMFENIMRPLVPAFPVLFGVGVFGSLIVILGGASMLTRSSRGLSIFASLLAMIPFVSSCCCVIGLPIGIWSLIVLMNADVKAAFAAKSLPIEDAY